jgi:hypothetical protein
MDIPDVNATPLFHRSSFVDERHRILYVETPKAACTSIKYMLRSLVDAKPPRFSPYQVQTSAIMWVHTRDEMPFPTFGSLSAQRRHEIVTAPDWFKFCVIRHPYDRFFSAWRDKIFLVEPGFEQYQSDKSQKFVEFTDFADKVLDENPHTCDEHWRLQVSLLQPDYFNYTHIYDISRVGDLLTDLRQHLAAQGVTDKELVLPRSNESWPIRPDGFLTPDITARLRQYYRLDFERFNFPEREATAAVAATAASLVNDYTDAVYDRNRVIMELVAFSRRQRHLRRMVYFMAGKIVDSPVGQKGRSLVKTGMRKAAGSLQMAAPRRGRTANT